MAMQESVKKHEPSKEHSAESSRGQTPKDASTREQKAANTETQENIADTAKDVFSNANQKIQEQYKNMRDSLAEYTKRKPFITLGTAVLIGMGLALLIRR